MGVKLSTLFLTNPFFESTTIKWRISGPTQIKYKDNGEIDDRGVVFSNKAALGIASQKLKNIGLYYQIFYNSINNFGK